VNTEELAELLRLRGESLTKKIIADALNGGFEVPKASDVELQTLMRLRKLLRRRKAGYKLKRSTVYRLVKI
jgi:hypothetical protein